MSEYSIQTDGNKSKHITWTQSGKGVKRAYVRRRQGAEDWAGTGRYLCVVRCNESGNPSGPPSDFPIHNDLDDETILRAFVHSVNFLTGGTASCKPGANVEP